LGFTGKQYRQISNHSAGQVDAILRRMQPRDILLCQPGGKLIAATQNVTSLEGVPQRSRVTINVYDNLEKAQVSRNLSDYKEATSWVPPPVLPEGSGPRALQLCLRRTGHAGGWAQREEAQDPRLLKDH
jgi:hypothetical protein